MVPNAADFNLEAFTLNIGSDKVSLGPGPTIEIVKSSGRFEVLAESGLTGTGPLAGNDVFLAFIGSSNSDIANLKLPSNFPTDFTSTDLSYLIKGQVDSLHDLGPLTSFSSTVPEPASLTLAGVVAAVLSGYAWRRRR
jgi:hypothetical protein